MSWEHKNKSTAFFHIQLLPPPLYMESFPFHALPHLRFEIKKVQYNFSFVSYFFSAPSYGHGTAPMCSSQLKCLIQHPKLSQPESEAKLWKSQRRNCYEKIPPPSFLPWANKAWQHYLFQKYSSILHFKTSIFWSNFQLSAAHTQLPTMRDLRGTAQAKPESTNSWTRATSYQSSNPAYSLTLFF